MKLKLSSSDITGDIKKEFKEKVLKKLEKDLQSAMITLSKGAVKEAEKLAGEKLPGALSDIYKKNLYMEQLSDNITEVGIREEALWLENGRKSGFMEELLTQKSGSPVKTAKDGSKYRVIPFEHATKTAPNMSSSGQEMVNELKTFLKRKGVAYSKTRALALDDSGSPRIGKIHSFDAKDLRVKTKKGVKELSPNLRGLSVYQSMNEKTGRVERNIMTFRVISEKHRGEKWMHPGTSGKKIIKEVFEWVQTKWYRELLPQLRDKYEGKR